MIADAALPLLSLDVRRLTRAGSSYLGSRTSLAQAQELALANYQRLRTSTNWEDPVRDPVIRRARWGRRVGERLRGALIAEGGQGPIVVFTEGLGGGVAVHRLVRTGPDIWRLSCVGSRISLERAICPQL